MSERRVIIIGGGIGGLALGLTLHQIGVRCSIYESVRNLKPLGVGWYAGAGYLFRAKGQLCWLQLATIRRTPR
jgi:2-polyprenyl-6-methoxyphenol hydroxylase-like FAD-dependent oxidoreductase